MKGETFQLSLQENFFQNGTSVLSPDIAVALEEIP